MVEKLVEFSKNTVIAFIDLGKAFNDELWKEHFHTLEEIGADSRYKRRICSLQKNQSIIVKIVDKSETAIIRKGVRQKCPLSPVLFNMYVE